MRSFSTLYLNPYFAKLIFIVFSSLINFKIIFPKPIYPQSTVKKYLFILHFACIFMMLLLALWSTECALLTLRT